MIIEFCINRDHFFLTKYNFNIQWDFPIMPRVGEDICLGDFLPEENIDGLYVKVGGVWWVKDDGIIKPVIYIIEK